MANDWYDEEYKDRSRYGLRVARVLFDGKSDFQRVEILETPALGRVLVIDGIFMTSERDEYFYHEMLVHPALVTAPAIGRVLVIGGGDGGTVREVLRHAEVQHVRMVEIDPLVVSACKEHLSTIGTAWDDPRLELTIADGIAYVKDTDDEPYDVVLLDGTDPVGPGEGLFNLDFYRGVRRVLRPGGVFALQSESPFMTQPIFVEIQKTLARVFPTLAPYFGTVPLYASGPWSWTYATDTADPAALDGRRLDALEPGCQMYNRALHHASFVQPNYVRALLSGERAPFA